MAAQTPESMRVVASRFVDLSHAIHDGLVTYPGISTPRIGAELTREASRSRYAPGTEFHIGRIEMSTNTGTYLDTPFHRFADGFDLAALPLEAVADLPGARGRRCPRGGAASSPPTCRRRRSSRAAPCCSAPAGRVTSERRLWRRPPVPLGGRGRAAGRGATPRSSASTRSTSTQRQVTTAPVHTALLAARIPIVEHLTGLDALPRYRASASSRCP